MSSTCNVKKLYLVNPKNEIDSYEYRSPAQGIVKFIVVLLVITAVVLAVCTIWYTYGEEWKQKLFKKFTPKPALIPIKQEPKMVLPPYSITPLKVERPKITIIKEPFSPIPADKQPRPKEDLLKVGIYTKKEATREYSWFSRLSNMEVLIPNLSKKLEKSKDQNAATYIEKEIIRNGKLLTQGMSEFNIPSQFIRSAKVIAFTQSKIMVPFSLNGKNSFGLIVPISSGLKLKVESEEEAPVLEEVTELDEPKLFRTNDSIIIEQSENTPKQFILFHLNDPVIIENLIVFDE